jgi:uncharacterized membrane protein
MRSFALVLSLVACSGSLACGGSTPPPAFVPPGEAVDSGAATAADTPASDVDASSAATSSTPMAAAVVDASAPPAAAPVAEADAGPAFDMTLVFGVAKQHQEALVAACWRHSKSTDKAYRGKTHLRLGPTGKVLSSSTEGTDDAASACIDKQLKKWKFPPPNGTATIELPIHMLRE